MAGAASHNTERGLEVHSLIDGRLSFCLAPMCCFLHRVLVCIPIIAVRLNQGGRREHRDDGNDAYRVSRGVCASDEDEDAVSHALYSTPSI